ncbi:MAG: T9SS type A sorting domain-containing protein [Bacteroidota bacterium]
MKSFLTSLLFLLSICLQAQITGTVNTYAAVSVVNAAGAKVTVTNTTGFAVGDLVLLMQMQGAQINENSNASFGTITSLNGAGLYELQRICDIDANEISFENNLINTYNSAGLATPAIQLIKVPEYVNVDVGALTVPAWDGTSGGVLVIAASGTINLVDNISLDGQGYRGANSLAPTSNCNFGSDFPNYFYNTGNYRGNNKGEGIAAWIVGKEAGRGPQANGGGGGNDHNTGGGGGANFGAGGIGGTTQNLGFFDCPGDYAGVGGKALGGLAYSAINPAVFMGGGGGAGHANNTPVVNGGNGGGLVLLIADVIEGNGFSISVNGETPANAGSDGGSGGGAGGSILLNTNAFGPTALNLLADGGNGGGASYVGFDCQGPGGAGGGGVIWTASAFPANINTSVNGGNRGINRPVNGCPNGSGVADGSAGTVIETPALSVPQGFAASSNCVLPVSWRFFSGRKQGQYFQLDWQLLGGDGDGEIVLRRSLNATEFGPIQSFSEGDGKGKWLITDLLPLTQYYQLQYIGADGEQAFSDIVAFSPAAERFSFWLSPNPSPSGQTPVLYVQLPEEGELDIMISNLLGQHFYAHTFYLASGERQVELPELPLSAGTYLVSAIYKGQRQVWKWIKE